MRPDPSAAALAIAMILGSSAVAQPPPPQPQPSPPSAPAVSGVTVEGKTSGVPKDQCKAKDSACIKAVVAALHALTGPEKEKFEIWCMANVMAQMRRSTYYGGGREDSNGMPANAGGSASDSNSAIEMACSNIPPDKKAKG
jgi:hypothetical protein